jgi:hypothetical protein
VAAVSGILIPHDREHQNCIFGYPHIRYLFFQKHIKYIGSPRAWQLFALSGLPTFVMPRNGFIKLPLEDTVHILMPDANICEKSTNKNAR